MKPQQAFGATFKDDRNHVPVWTICGTASDVRRRIEEAYDDSGLELKAESGWITAKKKFGARVVKLQIKINR
jgi:hypothetical protein